MFTTDLLQIFVCVCFHLRQLFLQFRPNVRRRSIDATQCWAAASIKLMGVYVPSNTVNVKYVFKSMYHSPGSYNNRPPNCWICVMSVLLWAKHLVYKYSNPSQPSQWASLAVRPTGLMSSAEARKLAASKKSKWLGFFVAFPSSLFCHKVYSATKVAHWFTIKYSSWRLEIISLFVFSWLFVLGLVLGNIFLGSKFTSHWVLLKLVIGVAS